jgi:hypothetical protein
VSLPATHASKDFAFAEFAVSASHKGLVRPLPAALKPRIARLATLGLQPVRDRLQRPLRILSGYRPSELNKAVGGSPTSQHVTGEAADFTCDDILGAFKTVMAMTLAGDLRGIGQIIYYPSQSFIHMALVSTRYETATCHVHWPEKGLKYRVVSPTPTALEKLMSSVRSA